MNTDLTETDFLSSLNLEHKIHTFFSHPSDIKNDNISHKSEKKPKNELFFKFRIIRLFYLGCLVIRFTRNLKNSIIFPMHIGKERKRKKLILMNDRSFFQEGLKTGKKIKDTQKILENLWKNIFLIERIFSKFLFKVLMRWETTFLKKIWNGFNFFAIFLILFLIPLNMFQEVIIISDGKILAFFQFFFLFDLIIRLSNSFQVDYVTKIEIYSKKSFLIDFLGIVSLFIIRINPCFSFLFLLKLGKIKELLNDFSQNSKLLKEFSFGLIFQIFIVFCQILIFCNFMACLWIHIGESGVVNLNDSWILNEKI